MCNSFDCIPTYLPAKQQSAWGISDSFLESKDCRYRFEEDHPVRKGQMLEAFQEIERYGNLTFVEDLENPVIRISFRDGGSHSYVGRDNLHTSKNASTLTIGWTDKGHVGTCIHETCHALGFWHSQSSKFFDFDWDKEQVYKDCAEWGWSPEKVNWNIFRTYTGKNYFGSEDWDEKSIMQYGIRSSWSLSGRSIPYNNELSSTDKEVIGKRWPFPEKKIEKTNTMSALRHLYSSPSKIDNNSISDLREWGLELGIELRTFRSWRQERKWLGKEIYEVIK